MAADIHYHDHEKHSDMPASAPSNALTRQPTIQLTSEQYERLFFQPGGPRKMDLASTFGNPTPLAIISHLLCLTPTACILMGWNNTTSLSLVTLVGPFYFIGGLGLFISGLLEWILGNTFPFIVFCSFGGFWFSLGTLQDPSKLATSAFPTGAAARDFNTGVEFYFIFWAVLCVIYFIASLRTNMIFAEIFFTLIFTFIFLAAGYDKIGSGDTDIAVKLLKAAGAFAFACVVGGWYLALALVFSSVDMLFVMPVGDLSNFMKRRSG